MGCDVHMFLEIRGYSGRVLSLVYSLVDLFGPDISRIVGSLADSSEWILASKHEDDDSDEFKMAPKADERIPPWRTRDYDMFACLADVRNNYGEHITPISPPRGLPFDLSAAVAALGVEHTPSFLMLNEVDPDTNRNFWAKRRKRDGSQSYRDAYLPDSGFDEWIAGVRSYQRKHRIPDDFIRLVFWFDS